MIQPSISPTTLKEALAAWRLQDPLTITRGTGGFTSETWLVETGADRYIAKLAHDDQSSFETGLLVAEIVDRHGIPSGAPYRTTSGALSVMVSDNHGQRHPLALLHLVPGESLDLTDPDAPRIIGNILGNVHRVVHREQSTPRCPERLFRYLVTQDDEEHRQPWLRPMIHRVVDRVRRFEADIHVTYGITYGDFPEFLHERHTGQIGLIDWGTVGHGPLLFDVALTVEMFEQAGIRRTDTLFNSYLTIAPVAPQELTGIACYIALLRARQAKYFAWRLAHNVTRGDSIMGGNARRLATARRQLEESLNDLPLRMTNG